MRRLGRGLVRWLLDVDVGRRVVGVAALERPDVLLGALGWSLSKDARVNPAAWPATLSKFEDVAPLVLSSNPANRGLAAMSLVEVAHLWKLAGEAGSGVVVEIGRERGGSTFVLAAALAGGGGWLFSFDPQLKLASRAYDEELSEVLARCRIGSNVILSSEDSHRAEPPAGEYALVLVDGDPSLEGTRLDFERFGRRTRVGGHVLFHDAVGGPRAKALAPLLREIDADPAFERRPDVGTFAHYTRRRSASRVDGEPTDA